MAQDFESMLRELFGDSFNRFTQFQQEQMKRLTDKLQEIAREAVKEELTRLNGEVAELRSRLTRLEEERAEKAAERV